MKPQPLRTVSTVRPFRLTVTLSSGRVVEVEGRTARLVAWLLSRYQRIENLPTGEILFHVGRQHFTPELHERFAQESADALPSSEELAEREA